MVNIYSDIYNLHITCSRLFGLYLQIITTTRHKSFVFNFCVHSLG